MKPLERNNMNFTYSVYATIDGDTRIIAIMEFQFQAEIIARLVFNGYVTDEEGKKVFPRK